MPSHNRLCRFLLRPMVLAAIGGLTVTGGAKGTTGDSYSDLVALFEDWRAFERPPTTDGAPDYSEPVMAAKHRELKKYQARLMAIDTDGWPVARHRSRARCVMSSAFCSNSRYRGFIRAR